MRLAKVFVFFALGVALIGCRSRVDGRSTRKDAAVAPGRLVGIKDFASRVPVVSGLDRIEPRVAEQGAALFELKSESYSSFYGGWLVAVDAEGGVWGTTMTSPREFSSEHWLLGRVRPEVLSGVVALVGPAADSKPRRRPLLSKDGATLLAWVYRKPGEPESKVLIAVAETALPGSAAADTIAGWLYAIACDAPAFDGVKSFPLE